MNRQGVYHNATVHMSLTLTPLRGPKWEGFFLPAYRLWRCTHKVIPTDVSWIGIYHPYEWPRVGSAPIEPASSTEPHRRGMVWNTVISTWSAYGLSCGQCIGLAYRLAVDQMPRLSGHQWWLFFEGHCCTGHRWDIVNIIICKQSRYLSRDDWWNRKSRLEQELWRHRSRALAHSQCSEASHRNIRNDPTADGVESWAAIQCMLVIGGEYYPKGPVEDGACVS